MVSTFSRQRGLRIPGLTELANEFMSEPNEIPWRRVFTESVAVVLSILLAFTIDAWWDGHKERQREHVLMLELLEDFRSSRPGLESRLDLSLRMASGTEGFQALVAAQNVANALVVPDTFVFAVLGGPTYEPVTNTLDAALASGEIELLSSEKLRMELAKWRRILADTAEDEREVRRITNEQLFPLLARSSKLSGYFDGLLEWSGGDPYSSGRLIEGKTPDGADGSVAVEPSDELAGMLALRRFYVELAAADLEDLLASLDRVIALLESETGD